MTYCKERYIWGTKIFRTKIPVTGHNWDLEPWEESLWWCWWWWSKLYCCKNETNFDFSNVPWVQPSVIINRFLRLLFIVEVAHEHMAATDADLDENSKANWLNCLQLYNYQVGRYANSNNWHIPFVYIVHGCSKWSGFGLTTFFADPTCTCTL